MTDLWPSFSIDDTDKESHAVEILSEQAALLSQKTGGLVKAKFFVAEYNIPMKTLGEKLSRLMAPSLPVETENAELASKTDINQLYQFTTYHFEIYNETYHFRVFTLKNRVVFPIKMDIDEGIWEELSFPVRTQPLDIESDDDLKDVVRQVFASHKTKSIINRLMGSTTVRTNDNG